MELLRSAAAAFASPVFLTSHWITSTHEGGGSPDCNETYSHGAGPVDSTLAEA